MFSRTSCATCARQVFLFCIVTAYSLPVQTTINIINKLFVLNNYNLILNFSCFD